MKTDATRETDLSLTISKYLNTDPKTAFDYLTEARHLQQWFAPTRDMRTDVRKLELAVGGEFEIAMIDDSLDKEHVVTGTFIEIDCPNRLVYSWHWTTEPEDEVSKVEITLSQQTDGTLLELIHSRFTSSESRDKHAQGWAGCLCRLEEHISG